MGPMRLIWQGSAEASAASIAPLLAGGEDEDAKLGGIEREDAGILEEAAVKAEELLIEDDRVVGAGLHFGKELSDLGHESLGMVAEGLKQMQEAILGEESDILGKHAEEAAGEELGDQTGWVS